VKQPTWVLRETALTVHDQLMARFGGVSGVRDTGLLDSTLTRPRNQLAYGEATLFDLAAAYAFGIVKNHPFVDGNKRTGFTIAALFIELNGYTFAAGEAEAVVRTLALAAGDISQTEYATWLKVNSKRETRSKR
jgi:death-on-curing protein